MEKLQLLDTLTEIDMECNKINAIISNLYKLPLKR